MVSLKGSDCPQSFSTLKCFDFHLHAVFLVNIIVSLIDYTFIFYEEHYVNGCIEIDYVCSFLLFQKLLQMWIKIHKIRWVQLHDLRLWCTYVLRMWSGRYQSWTLL